MVRIKFQSIDISSVSNTSGVFSGENRQVGWKDNSKKNEGFGKLSGSGNKLVGGSSTVRDEDHIDVSPDKES